MLDEIEAGRSPTDEASGSLVQDLQAFTDEEVSHEPAILHPVPDDGPASGSAYTLSVAIDPALL